MRSQAPERRRKGDLIDPLKAAFANFWQARSLCHASGTPVLTIDNNAAAAHLVRALWSPDSKRVVVIEDYPRGSGVFAAWFDGKSWDKTLQKD